MTKLRIYGCTSVWISCPVRTECTKEMSSKTLALDVVYEFIHSFFLQKFYMWSAAHLRICHRSTSVLVCELSKQNFQIMIGDFRVSTEMRLRIIRFDSQKIIRESEICVRILCHFEHLTKNHSPNHEKKKERCDEV